MGESNQSVEKVGEGETSKKRIDFSIDGLLKEPYISKNPCVFENRYNFQVNRFSENIQIPLVLNQALGKDKYESCKEEKQNFSWLFCSRFKPPKLPRSKKRSNSKRYGRGPRIPFAAHQITVLENAFTKSHYLSPDCICRLAETLYLSETRVKIWFQNRRARFRREQEMLALNSSMNPPSSPENSSESKPIHHHSYTTATTPPAKLRIKAIYTPGSHSPSAGSTASDNSPALLLHPQPDSRLPKKNPGLYFIGDPKERLSHSQNYRQSRSLSPEILSQSPRHSLSVFHPLSFSPSSAFVSMRK